MENFKTIIQKVVAVTYKRWSFREGLKINAVIWPGKCYGFWIGGHLQGVVAYGGLTVYSFVQFLRENEHVFLR